MAGSFFTSLSIHLTLFSNVQCVVGNKEKRPILSTKYLENPVGVELKVVM
jgi:hypothetical protein